MRRNDDPPDEIRAYEKKINGVWFAWDEDGHVYMQHAIATRDDGYMLVGFFDGDDEEQFVTYVQTLINGT